MSKSCTVKQKKKKIDMGFKYAPSGLFFIFQASKNLYGFFLELVISGLTS